MSRGHNTLRRGFSLIELVIVIVIIGIIAAIAIPRMSRGAEGAAESSLRANLAVLRNAIDLFYTEHENEYPKVATFKDQMLGKTDLSGAVTASGLFGPYLREIPIMPVKGDGQKDAGVAAANAANIGWLYNESTGDIRANSTVVPTGGTAYNTW
jgi:prepilin-type N-terminal cleavage/methylation domain-containing protein